MRPAALLDRFRERLAYADALLPLALVGVASGIVTGGVIIAFRALTESTVTAMTGNPEHFEALARPLQLALPLVGGLVIGLAFQRFSLGSRQVGVIHVMDRLAFHSGRLPWRNAMLQFAGGALSIVCGHSVGREGPVIHVGAASASLLGQWVGLPHNSLRILVACGVAAAIAASFNTPIAGVIFAMEVVMMEYTMVGFTPVILASVGATSLSRFLYGGDPAFAVPAMQMASLWELPWILLVGIALGTAAALYIVCVRRLDESLRHVPLWLRTTIAGAVTGACALAAPEIMGIGYDTVEGCLLGAFGLGALVAIAGLKLVATTACVSLGLPGGLIGPTLVIGAAGGGALGILGHAMVPTYSADAGFYALLGMGAMMGAVLQAPLAALMAILELTNNPNSILPGMFAIVTATLATRVGFGQDSVFVTMLRARGLEYRHDPVAIALARTGVGAVMDRRLAPAPRRLSRRSLEELATGATRWLLLGDDHRIAGVMRVEDAAHLLEGSADTSDSEVDLVEAPAARPFATVRLQATLDEALARMDERGVDLVLVTRTEVAMRNGVYGVLARNAIESGVRYGRNGP